jgi:hypothetical protein
MLIIEALFLQSVQCIRNVSDIHATEWNCTSDIHVYKATICKCSLIDTISNDEDMVDHFTQ